MEHQKTNDMGRPFDLDEAIVMLSRTPAIVAAMLRGMPAEWTGVTEGPDTWSPFDVVGHLIHGERTDWMPRARIILQHGDTRAFDPFDREAQFTESRGRSLTELLDEFAELRERNLKDLRALKLTGSDLDRAGRHPALGPVTMRQLLATWVAHDFDHVVQIARVLGRQYTREVGPWRAYLRVISGSPG